MKKTLNVKQMVNTYLYSWGDMEFTWDTFYGMTLLGFISDEEWKKFCDKCSGWVYDSEKHCVVDMATGETVKTF